MNDLRLSAQHSKAHTHTRMYLISIDSSTHLLSNKKKASKMITTTTKMKNMKKNGFKR